MSRKAWTGDLLVFARIILGAVFIFSGFVKGADPLGSAYKFSDYFLAFGLEFMEFASLPLAFILSTAEFLIGISLLFNLKFRLGAWAVLIFMSFFTILALILALTNPVTDCGCFGDAIIMTNWQTFIKNVILLPFVLIIFIFWKKQPVRFPGAYAWLGIIIFALGFLAMERNVYQHLPLLDFRPYNVGTNIPEKMSIPEGAAQDIYRTILFYEKNGEVREFTEDNFPWQDSTWKFVDSEHQLVSKGYEPLIHDFTITDSSGTDITYDILADPGFTFLMVSTHLEKADVAALNYADDLNAFCDLMGHSFYCLTASSEDVIREVSTEQGLSFNVNTTDEITLKTIIRANPGILLLQEGNILAKWHYNDFPSLEDAATRTLPSVLTSSRQTMEKRAGFVAILLVLAAGMCMFLVFPRRRST